MNSEAVLSTDLNLPNKRSGKVRDLYDVELSSGPSALLIIATDRVSAFDVVMENGLPGKGIVLTQISNFWFEFFADKVPGVDIGWDTLHTFIRLPAGALLAAGMFDDQSMGLELAAAIVGGGLAATSHAAKAGSRVLINTSPEPFSNWTASIAEDISVFGGVWLMLNQPWTFVGLLIVFLLLLVWLLPKLWRGIKVLFAKIRGIFVSKPVQAEPAQAADVQSKSNP